MPLAVRAGLIALAAAALATTPARAQRATLAGHVSDAATHEPVAGVLVTVEGTRLAALTDSGGSFRIDAVPPGPQVLLARRIGYAPTRIPFTAPATGTATIDVAMAHRALQLPSVIVTATPEERATGELGTASVVDREAIAHQTAATLQGVLELTPGVVLAAPGLDEAQQVSLRAVPASFGQALTLGASTGPSAADITAFGTAIVLDGVPLSNNANLQTLGPRGEAFIATSAGGGVDLRQIPASTLERVEVIRGVPSARYGDITNGVIVVETRAGDVAPEARASYDPRTFITTLLGGRSLSGGQTGTATLDVARTLLSPATSASGTTRIAAQLQHRLVLGPAPDTTPGSAPGHLVLDSHVDFYRLFADNPEDPVFPGHANYTHDAHVRVNERARLALGRHTSATWTVAVDKTSQRSFEQDSLVRPAMPFTDRLTPGRQTGHFIFGPYLSRLTLQGDPWLFYSRLELSFAPNLLGATNVLRAGGELRREWNGGPGYQFDQRRLRGRPAHAQPGPGSARRAGGPAARSVALVLVVVSLAARRGPRAAPQRASVARFLAAPARRLRQDRQAAVARSGLSRPRVLRRRQRQLVSAQSQ